MDSISASFLLVFIMPIVAYVITNNLHYLALFIGIFIFGGTIEIIKILFGNEGKFARPKDACQCDLLCLSMDDSDKPGYPSGHVAISTFFVGCMLGLIMSQYKLSILWYLIGILIGSIWIIAIAKSRIQKKCHTKEQVIVGFIAGIIGVISYLGMLSFLQLI